MDTYRRQWCNFSLGYYQRLVIIPFYCVNTSYPMDNCFTGRHDWSRQTSEKDILYIILAGPVIRAHSPGGASYFLFLSRQRDVIASFLFCRVESEDVFSRQANFLFYIELNTFDSSLKKFRSIIYNYVISRTEKRFLRTCYGWVRLPLQVCTL